MQLVLINNHKTEREGIDPVYDLQAACSLLETTLWPRMSATRLLRYMLYDSTQVTPVVIPNRVKDKITQRVRLVLGVPG